MYIIVGDDLCGQLSNKPGHSISYKIASHPTKVQITCADSQAEQSLRYPPEDSYDL